MRQKLRSYVQDSARKRMYCEDDVLQYYRQFLCYSAPLVHSGHLSEEERDAAFWYGFHSEDREVLRPRLISKNPFQPSDIPFHFEDVFVCARAAFAYDGSSFWSHVKQFEPPIVRREQPIVEPISRDAYGFRAVTCAIASNAETTTTPDELSPPSYSTPDSDFPHPLILPSESQHTQAPSVTLDLPETAHTFSSTLLPSASPRSHTPSLVYSATDNDPISAPTFPITTSTLLPSVSPTPSHDSLLAHSAADVPEISSTPLSSPTLAPFSMPISSDVEYLSSATVDQPAPTLLPSIHTLPTPSHVHSAIDNFVSTPLSSSPTLSTYLPSPTQSTTDDQPEPESTSMSLPLPKLGLPACALSLPPDQTLAPLSSSPLSSSPLQEISSLGSLPVAPSPDQPSSLLESLSQLSRPCELESSTLVSAADVVTLSHPELPLSSPGEPVPFLPASSETPPNAPISPHSTLPQRRPELKTIGSVSTPLESSFRHSSTFRQLFSPTRASSGARIKTPATVRTAPQVTRQATTSRIGSNSDSTRPAPHASFSTPEARLQVQDFSRHTKTFASSSRRHAASSSRTTPPFPLLFPLPFQSTISSFSIPKV
ncbi:hypothetical protein EDB89DRAFT_389163 [Lactarius sanguifluus]|nr:hypothetical protein EDB89DRAFT_389163 [Lactarius sanguifluus]